MSPENVESEESYISCVEKALADHIINNVPLSSQDVVVITINYFDNDTFLTDIAYLVFRQTMTDLNLSLHYDIRNDDEDNMLIPLYELASYVNIPKSIFDSYAAANGWHINFP